MRAGEERKRARAALDGRSSTAFSLLKPGPLTYPREQTARLAARSSHLSPTSPRPGLGDLGLKNRGTERGFVMNPGIR